MGHLLRELPEPQPLPTAACPRRHAVVVACAVCARGHPGVSFAQVIFLKHASLKLLNNVPPMLPSLVTQAQHMVMDTLALAVSASANYYLRNREAQRMLLPLLAFPVCGILDLFCIYK